MPALSRLPHRRVHLPRSWRQAIRALRRHRRPATPQPIAPGPGSGVPGACRCAAVPTRQVLGNGTVLDLTAHTAYCPVWHIHQAAHESTDPVQPPSDATP